MGAKPRTTNRLAIASHPIFKPALIGWAGAILALVILVLPEPMIARLTMLTGLGFIGEFSRYVFAIVAAVLGGGIGFAIASIVQGRFAADDSPADAADDVSGSTKDSVDPIDPATELGSESLDSPIETAEFEEISANEAEEDHRETNANGISEGLPNTLAAQAALDALVASSDASMGSRQAYDDPVSLDLEEFAALPGRDAVWVNGPIDTNAPAGAGAAGETPMPQAAPAQAVTALEKLRAAPLEELSMVQMIERFAAALEDRRAAESADMSDRDVTFFKALKKLADHTDDTGPVADQANADETGESHIESHIEHENAKSHHALGEVEELRGAA